MYLSNSVSCCSEIPEITPHRGHHQYGKQAKLLWQSRALLSPSIVQSTGSALEFQRWACEQPCVITGCESDNHFVQVRKPFNSHDPAYLGVTMSDSVMQLYNNRGLQVTLRYYGVVHRHEPEETVRTWLHLTAGELLHQWVWEALKHKLGFQHWYDIPPQCLQAWAKTNGLEYALPVKYRETVSCL
jgi:hypothetical protein